MLVLLNNSYRVWHNIISFSEKFGIWIRIIEPPVRVIYMHILKLKVVQCFHNSHTPKKCTANI